MDYEMTPDFTELRDKQQLIELANRLFMYTDARNWQGLIDEVFSPTVYLDMESNGGGPPAAIPSQAITDGWNQGFQDLDSVHHQAGHYLVTLHGNQADIYGYAVATHFKATATQGQTRTFVGSYDLKAEWTDNGWRLNQLKYNLKFSEGNMTLE